MGPVQGARQSRDGLAGTAGEDEEHARTGWASEQCGHQLSGGPVHPMEIVEDEHDGLAGGDELQQVPDRPVAAVALVLEADRDSDDQRK